VFSEITRKLGAICRNDNPMILDKDTSPLRGLQDLFPNRLNERKKGRVQRSADRSVADVLRF